MHTPQVNMKRIHPLELHSSLSRAHFPSQNQRRASGLSFHRFHSPPLNSMTQSRSQGNPSSKRARSHAIGCQFESLICRHYTPMPHPRFGPCPRPDTYLMLLLPYFFTFSGNCFFQLKKEKYYGTPTLHPVMRPSPSRVKVQIFALVEICVI